MWNEFRIVVVIKTCPPRLEIAMLYIWPTCPPVKCQLYTNHADAGARNQYKICRSKLKIYPLPRLRHDKLKL